MHNVFSSEEILKATDAVVKVILEYSGNNKSSTCLQKLQTLKLEDICKQRLLQLALTHMLQAEAVSAGGYDGFLAALNKKSLKGQVTAFDRSKLSQLLQTFVDTTTADILNDCLDMTGIHGKIVLSSHPVNGEDSIIELNNSCFFPDMTSVFEIKSTKFLNPRIVCIDGYVESVSELHRMLEDAATLKDTIVLFVRGLSDEVVHTLKVNYDRGSLQIIPVIIKYDLEGVNLLNDVAAINSSDVVSTYKGQLINNVDITNFARIESVDVTSTGVLIENSSATSAINSHIKFLQEKIIKSENQYEKDVLTKRIQNLGMNRVTIRLGEEKDKLQRSLEIDRALRAVKNASSYGVCEIDEKLYPYSAIKAGTFYAEKFLKSAHNLGALISD